VTTATPPRAWAALPPDATAVLEHELGGAPRELRALVALAAAGHGVTWRVWRIGPEHDPAGWTLAVTVPGGTLHRYTWVRSGGRMRLVAQSETALPPGERGG
jgi:hypothetical protein